MLTKRVVYQSDAVIVNHVICVIFLVVIYSETNFSVKALKIGNTFRKHSWNTKKNYSLIKYIKYSINSYNIGSYYPQKKKNHKGFAIDIKFYSTVCHEIKNLCSEYCLKDCLLNIEKLWYCLLKIENTWFSIVI